MARLTKAQKSELAQIKVWNDINTDLVEKFGPTAQIVNETPVDSVADVLAQTSQQLDTNAAVVAQVEAKVNKAKIGRKIFEEELAKGSARKDIIKRLMTEALLTKNGAATYLQNMKKKAGLVKSTPKAA